MDDFERVKSSGVQDLVAHAARSREPFQSRRLAEPPKGVVAATVESVKAASEVYAPVGGEVIAVNERLAGEPGLVNAEPTGNGWMFKMKNANAADIDGLLDEDAYKAWIAASDEGH